MSNQDQNDLSFIASSAKDWLDSLINREFKGAKFFWTKDKAREFADVPIETLLFDEYFLNGKKWLYPGIVDTILDIYEQRKTRKVKIVCVAAGFGCLPSYTPIKTNNGYVTMENLSVGDKILGVNGDTTEECNVIRKIYSGKKEVFRVYTKDGNYIDATKEHIFEVWICENNIGRYRQNWSISSIINYLCNDKKTTNFISLIRINNNQTNEITGYKSLGYMDTYDISIDNKSKCFLSYNDFITHNSGKTEGLGAVLNWLNWYHFSCKFKPESTNACPQEYYDLKPTSKVAFIALSKTLEKSKLITFSAMRSAFSSHFNQEYFPINPRILSRLDIPGNNTMVFPNTATEAANAGWSIFSFVMDEISFLQITDNSSRSIGSSKDVYDQAKEAFDSAEGRMFSRFMYDGMGILISSVNYDEDFLMTKIRKAFRGDVSESDVYFKILLPWKANPAKFSMEKSFYFDTNKFEIIKDEKEIGLLDKYYVEVPIEQIIFGENNNDPNDKLLEDFRNGKIR